MALLLCMHLTLEEDLSTGKTKTIGVERDFSRRPEPIFWEGHFLEAVARARGRYVAGGRTCIILLELVDLSTLETLINN